MSKERFSIHTEATDPLLVLNLVSAVRIGEVIRHWYGTGSGFPAIVHCAVADVAKNHTIQGTSNPGVRLLSWFSRLVRNHMMGFFPDVIQSLSIVSADSHLSDPGLILYVVTEVEWPF